MSLYDRHFKRLLDFVLAFAAIAVLAPFLVLIAVAVLWRLGRPVLFFQPRMGYKNSTFRVAKFRTMSNAVDREGELLKDSQRITHLGRFLRRHSLDELPQLFHVLTGRMSLIGPRPLAEYDRHLLSAADLQRHETRPGITGLAQISGRNAVSWEKRFELDRQYIREMSFWGDLKILGSTCLVLLHREGTNENGWQIPSPTGTKNVVAIATIRNDSAIGVISSHPRAASGMSVAVPNPDVPLPGTGRTAYDTSELTASSTK